MEDFLIQRRKTSGMLLPYLERILCVQLKGMHAWMNYLAFRLAVASRGARAAYDSLNNKQLKYRIPASSIAPGIIQYTKLLV